MDQYNNPSIDWRSWAGMCSKRQASGEPSALYLSLSGGGGDGTSINMQDRRLLEKSLLVHSLATYSQPSLYKGA
ncbi:hypothetical protein ElyMa_004679100 [Elysia marginata]|uniref:Uncharacterized protein n=1 Tax=Elysia marginata TaxID=1093978 RepID=A0AAV4I754_9GAST|nr:hypothetical protein ElyMa_004679100 [Elysia marginata]